MWTSRGTVSTLGWILPRQWVEMGSRTLPDSPRLSTVTVMNQLPNPSVASAVALPTPPAEVAFHRLGIAPGARGWRPLLVVLLAAALYVVSALVLVMAAMVVELATGLALSERALAMDMNDPFAFVSGFALIAWMLPPLLLARWVVGPRPVGLLASVTGRLRWRWLARALLISGVVYAVGLTLQLVVLDPLTGIPLVPARLIPSALVFLLAAVLLVPLQAAAEEYVFRGALMQLVGGWLRHPVFAIVLPVPLFVVGHGYDVLGQTGIAVFALLTGWITWRTGGLEAAIALHVVNNSLLTVLQAVGWADPNATATTATALVLSVVVQAVAGLVAGAHRRPARRRAHPTGGQPDPGPGGHPGRGAAHRARTCWPARRPPRPHSGPSAHPVTRAPAGVPGRSCSWVGDSGHDEASRAVPHHRHRA